MTKAARLVLEDAKHAIDRHTDDLQGADFRISWIAIITLLRTVGHVLEKVDGKSEGKMRDVIRAKWAEPKPLIFTEFIEGERNRYIKNYELGVRRSIFAWGKIGDEEHAFQLHANIGTSRGVRGVITPGRYQSSLTDGPFAGKSEKEVALQAYAWWVAYLDEVDQLAGAH